MTQSGETRPITTSQQHVTELVAAACREAFDVERTPEVTPADLQFGDFATNIAMQLKDELSESPRDIAQKIVRELQDMEGVASAEAAGPGFVNIVMADQFWSWYMRNMAENGLLAGARTSTPERMVVEYGQPNTHKLPHIAHLYSYVAGDVLARLLEAVGHTVRKVNYQGDIGLHVAKTLWGWRQKGKEIPETLDDKVILLQESYQLGVEEYEKDEQTKEAIDAINRRLYHEADEGLQRDWELTRQWSLDYNRQFEESLGVAQDAFYLESQVWETGVELVKKYTGSIFRESDGAVIFPGEEYGLHNRVFITGAEVPTYEAKDLGLINHKTQDWEFDRSIVTTGADQTGYFQVVNQAATCVRPGLSGKLEHIGFGILSLTSGKISSRAGPILSAQEVVTEVESAATAAIKEGSELTEGAKPEVTQAVALAAIKYGFLVASLEKNITFDIQKATSLHGQSGPYLLYSNVRIQSIIDKAGEWEVNYETDVYEAAEKELVRLVSQYSSVVRKAAEEREPHHLCGYLYQLSQQFNVFYEHNRVLDSDRRDIRLTIIFMVSQVLTEGLDTLGIRALRRM